MSDKDNFKIVTKGKEVWFVIPDHATAEQVKQALDSMPKEVYELMSRAKHVRASQFNPPKVLHHPPSLLTLGLMGTTGYEQLTEHLTASLGRQGYNAQSIQSKTTCAACGCSIPPGKAGRKCKPCRDQY